MERTFYPGSEGEQTDNGIRISSLALASLIIPDLVLRGLFLNAHHPGSLPAQLRWFEASTCMAASRDLPSSLVQHRTLEYKTLWCVRGTLLARYIHF
jgi:hypothetical protein